jgi:hypothetical protein
MQFLRVGGVAVFPEVFQFAPNVVACCFPFCKFGSDVGFIVKFAAKGFGFFSFIDEMICLCVGFVFVVWACAYAFAFVVVEF